MQMTLILTSAIHIKNCSHYHWKDTHLCHVYKVTLSVHPNNGKVSYPITDSTSLYHKAKWAASKFQYRLPFNLPLREVLLWLIDKLIIHQIFFLAHN